MKIIKQHFDLSDSNRKEKLKSKGSALAESSGKKGGGSHGGVVVMVPEEPEDMWILFNLIAKGDRLRSMTTRKVTREDQQSTSTELKRIPLTIKVATVDYDGDSDSLRVSGVVASENNYGVNLGVHHTMSLGLNIQVSIGKGRWDARCRSLIRDAASGASTADTIAVMLDSGIANIYLLTPSLEKLLASFRSNIPKRKGNSSMHDNAEKSFFNSVATGLDTHLTANTKVVIIAGPGFTKDSFLGHVIEHASKSKNAQAMSNRDLFLLVNSSSASKNSLKEVLCNESVRSRLSHLKSANNVRALEALYKMLQNDPGRVCYGADHCNFAIERGAVETLMITDSLFRASTAAKRRRYINMTEAVSQLGGSALVFSDNHTSGTQLNALTGIACILRYPLPPEETDHQQGDQKATPSREEEDEEDEVEPPNLDEFDAAM